MVPYDDIDSGAVAGGDPLRAHDDRVLLSLAAVRPHCLCGAGDDVRSGGPDITAKSTSGAQHRPHIAALLLGEFE